LCPQIHQPGAIIIPLDGGHHFDGHFAALGRRIESIIATLPPPR
jgi:type IV secretory pathway VirJ component